MFRLKLKDLRAKGICSTDWFDSRSEGKDYIEYPNGWDEVETKRLARDNPTGLLWLVSKGLIPVSFRAANGAIQEAHGEDAHEKIKRKFREDGDAVRARVLASRAQAASLASSVLEPREVASSEEAPVERINLLPELEPPIPHIKLPEEEPVVVVSEPKPTEEPTTPVVKTPSE